MAKRKAVVIDGEFAEVPATATLDQVVKGDVESVLTSKGEIVPRSEFSRWEVPAAFERNLTRVVKG